MNSLALHSVAVQCFETSYMSKIHGGTMFSFCTYMYAVSLGHESPKCFIQDAMKQMYNMFLQESV